jgi:hypothetical protein
MDINKDRSAKLSRDECIHRILERLREEYEIAKEKGFPSRKRNFHLSYQSQPDAIIPGTRWSSWLNDLDIDYTRFNDVLDILYNKGLLGKFEFINPYR